VVKGRNHESAQYLKYYYGRLVQGIHIVAKMNEALNDVRGSRGCCARLLSI
jgi:hypothetical protein